MSNKPARLGALKEGILATIAAHGGTVERSELCFTGPDGVCIAPRHRAKPGAFRSYHDFNAARRARAALIAAGLLESRGEGVYALTETGRAHPAAARHLPAPPVMMDEFPLSVQNVGAVLPVFPPELIESSPFEDAAAFLPADAVERMRDRDARANAWKGIQYPYHELPPPPPPPPALPNARLTIYGQEAYDRFPVFAVPPPVYVPMETLLNIQGALDDYRALLLEPLFMGSGYGPEYDPMQSNAAYARIQWRLFRAKLNAFRRALGADDLPDTDPFAPPRLPAALMLIPGEEAHDATPCVADVTEKQGGSDHANYS
jgi:hypothetical protein